MLRFNVKGRDISLSFSFFAIIALAAASDTKAVMISLLCCMIHEAGHLAAMLGFGVPVNGLCFYGGGIKIVAPDFLVNRYKEAVILSAGCAVNAAAYAVCALTGFASSEFALANLMLCVFNLMPFKKLDGGRLAELTIGISGKRYALFSTLRFAAAAVMILLLVKAFLLHIISFTLIAAALYIVISEALC